MISAFKNEMGLDKSDLPCHAAGRVIGVIGVIRRPTTSLSRE